MKPSQLVEIPVLCLFILGLAVLGTACRSPAESPSSNGAPGAPAAESGSAEPDSKELSSGDAVRFEPAYPADVSTEALDDGDTAQQQALSHGAEHSHGDGEHSHDQEHGGEQHDGDHPHGEGGDHSHGDDHGQ
ncbi:MAG: hypothetical protein AAGN66_10160 [Acidobacteriota bacterium]